MELENVNTINTSTINPTKPPSPNWVTIAVRLPIISIPNTVVPVSTCQRIATGSTANNNVNTTLKNPETI